MLAILTTHPVQWQVPVWQALADDGSVPFEVWFLTNHGVRPSLDVEFGQIFAWDLPLLDGYPHRFLQVREPARVDSFFGVQLSQSLIPLLHQKSVTALWVNGWQVHAYWQAVHDAQKAGARIWLRGESNDLRRLPRWKSAIKRTLLKRLFKSVDEWLYIGTANRRLYESFGVSPERLHHTPYAVDNDRFSGQADELRQDRESIRESWGISKNAYCVLFAAKFIPKKRPMDLVKAANILRTRGMDLHLLFVGSGALSAELRSACQISFDATARITPHTRGSSDLPNASFVGFLNQQEMSKAYVAADCLVLPSDHGETWGLVVNEAMATGLPCVVSDACGCAEDLVAPVEPSLRYPMGDIPRLADAIQRVAGHFRNADAWRMRVDAFRIDHTVAVARQLYNELDAKMTVRL